MNARVVINFALFQLGWFACVLGAASGISWVGTLSVLVILAHHLHSANDSARELQLIMLVLAIGFTWDSLLVAFAVLEYNTGLFHSALAPHWIIAMWALFACTLNVSLDWLKGRYLLSFVFGAVGGPLAFYAGMKLGAVSMPSETQALIILAIGWSCIMPALVLLSERFNGFRPVSQQRRGSRELYDV